MMILEKNIFFSKTYYYFIKDRNSYLPRDCHMNTYSRFYDNNSKEIRNNSKNYTYVTGLLCLKDEKVCMIHSWIEYNGMVVDVTSLANSQLSVSSDAKLLEYIKDYFDRNISYIPYSVLTNSKFDKKGSELMNLSYGNIDKFNELTEKWLNDLVLVVQNDDDFLSRVKDKYGYELKTGDFCFELS